MSRRARERPSPAKRRRAIGFLLTLFRRLMVAGAVAYPIALVVALALLAWIGESHWSTALGLYAPRHLALVPIPVFVLALLLMRRFRLLWTQGVALAIVIFPLMGFVVPWPVARSDLLTFRLLSLNVSTGQFGYDTIDEAVKKVGPDIAIFQEAPNGQHLIEALKARYPHVESSTQFVIASRFPITERTEPPRLAYHGGERSARFMRYVIATPSGPLALYSVHPASPRGVLQVYRLRGTFGRLRSGQLFEGDPGEEVGYNTGHRTLQVEAVAAMAARETIPLIIAGDTNLPGLSKIFRNNLAVYEDGFREASWGFGYTFPAKYPWLRLDRILVSAALRTVSFTVGCPGVSDHLCVHAEIQRR